MSIRRSSPKPIDFTDEDAREFRLAMVDPEVRAKLYEKTRLRSEELRNSVHNKIERASPTLVNEHGFTDEEVDFLKDIFKTNKTGGKYHRRSHKKGRKTKRTRKHRKSRKY